MMNRNKKYPRYFIPFARSNWCSIKYVVFSAKKSAARRYFQSGLIDIADRSWNIKEFDILAKDLFWREVSEEELALIL